MRDRSDRYRVESVPSLIKQKRLGSYLIDAGLLTKDQIDVALNDQQMTGMRFGDILVARGWIKEQTIEWIVDKVIEPEKKALSKQTQGKKVAQSSATVSTNASPNSSDKRVNRPSPADESPSPRSTTSSSPIDNSAFGRRDIPISKPLPSVGQTDGDVQWVG